jgi:hypothetical protein
MTNGALRDVVGRLNQVVRYMKIAVCYYGTPVIAVSFTPISEVNFNVNILLRCYVRSKEFCLLNVNKNSLFGSVLYYINMFV